MKFFTLIVGLFVMIGIASPVSAQFPTASEEHKILKMEEGNWDAKVTMFTGPEGPYEEPVVSEGKESNRMIGDFWIVSEFSGDFGGMAFSGQARFGYDSNKKKYFGTWVDSFSPSETKMVGSYDAESNTMTYETTGVGMDGSPSKGQNVVVYQGKDKRTMTMFSAMPSQDELVKSMEIVYTRAKGE